jgi:putative transposase
MTNIRRFFRENDIVFLTHVTYQRNPILVKHSGLLLEAIHKIENEFDCEIFAWVVLPDHFHILIDARGNDLSLLMRKLKLSFSANYRKTAGLRSGRVWQYRFWDHIIRDQEDMNRHLDYIHYNALKHGYVKNPFDWKYSSIHKYQSEYVGVLEDVEFEGEFGE